MNQVALVGRLSREVNLHEGETPFCNLSVAVTDGYGEKEYTSFIPVKVFGKSAENCAKYLSKGSQVAVTGRIQTGSYEKKDGTKVYTTEVIANHVEFIGSKGDAEPKKDSTPKGFEEIDESESIPF